MVTGVIELSFFFYWYLSVVGTLHMSVFMITLQESHVVKERLDNFHKVKCLVNDKVRL